MNMTKRPINRADLLHQRTVEGGRIDYKTGWNPDPIIRTVCTFANNFENLAGGYVVIGRDCDVTGQPVLPRYPLSLVPAVASGEVSGEVTGEVTGEVERLLRAVIGEMSRQQIQSALGLKSEEHFRKAYLKPALVAKVIEMTPPDAPAKQQAALPPDRSWTALVGDISRPQNGLKF